MERKKDKLMKRVIILSIVVFFCSAFYYRGDIIDIVRTWDKPENEKQFVKSLKQFVKSGKKSIALKELTTFKWEEACWFRPYDSYGPVKVKTNDCLLWQGDHCLDTESYWGIQFMDKGNPISICIPRWIVDYPIVAERCVLEDTAIAKLERIQGTKHRAPALILQIEGKRCNRF